jgi:hypothetical protein
MSRLKKLQVDSDLAMVQKTIRIPKSLYDDVDDLLRDARIDSFNKAVIELLKLEVAEWKEEKRKLEIESISESDDAKSESKTEVKKSTKKTTKTKRKSKPKSESNNESKSESELDSNKDSKKE